MPNLLDEAIRNLTIVAHLAGFGEPRSLAEIVAAIIGTVLSFVGIIFFCRILYGGFLWMISGGNEFKLATAKAVLKNSVIGLIIIMASYSITIFVTKTLIEVTH